MLLFKLNFMAMMLLQEAVGFDLRSMWSQMGLMAKAVVVVLALMSMWSFGVMVDRYIAYSQARKQSREFAPAVAGCLKEGKIEEAISVAEQSNRSHLAKVVEAGLQEFRSQGVSTDLSGEQNRILPTCSGTCGGDRKRRIEAWPFPVWQRLAPPHHSWGFSARPSASSTRFRVCRVSRQRVFPLSLEVFPRRLWRQRLVFSLRFPQCGHTTRSAIAWKRSRSRCPTLLPS